MARVAREGAYSAVKLELATVERTVLPPPPISVSLYLSLSLDFHRKELPIIDDERNLPFAAALCLSLPYSLSMSSQTTKRKILSSVHTTSRFKLCRVCLRVVLPYTRYFLFYKIKDNLSKLKTQEVTCQFGKIQIIKSLKIL